MPAQEEPYHGFEQGPIRPPSEAMSLLIRVSRNCPWNRCAFCPVYKGAKFSLRPVEHVLRDIDAVHRQVETLLDWSGADTPPPRDQLNTVLREVAPEERAAFSAAYHWIYAGGMKNVFLQDANALFMRTGDLLRILGRIRQRFPEVRRITSYARSHTLARKPAGDLAEMAGAGLNRLHIGMESGSGAVLEAIEKGVTKAEQITAGQNVKAAGMQLSEYVMPGLGGRTLSDEHARESADALNQINPDFIRLRTLAIPANTPLHALWDAGTFEKMNDIEVAREIRLFLAELRGITSMVKSDHVLNLFGELAGKLPEDQPAMLALLDRFLAMPPVDQARFCAGRRMGMLQRLADLEDPAKAAAVDAAMARLGITPANVAEANDALMQRFI
ncbi:MAG: radical SAM protein [Candidatus Hydrogenedentota bacterium]